MAVLSHGGEAVVNVWLLSQTRFFRIPYVFLPNMEGNAPPLPRQPRVSGSGNDGALPSSGNVKAGGRMGL